MKEKPFRVVKHVHQALPNEIVKYFETHDEAADYLNTKSNKSYKKGEKLHWIEGKINSEWYGLA